jgi:hypothetical protein
MFIGGMSGQTSTNHGASLSLAPRALSCSRGYGVPVAISHKGPGHDIGFEGVSLSPVGDCVCCLELLPVQAEPAGRRGRLADCGMTVSYETIRAWIDRFKRQMA